ncbi:hypothetical protein M422DRAFT_69753 [Sphaerobolus stellatus SS14]|uniref:Unplaced genomic scaffold SPHSTscaffold_104, whole genome shotgun sequence n=1 Tax=Sphaerobolus stellatus (strain SS14) TaxID=990650 RepID=A0A0C9V3N1_SPHS4|nr:hypothetical protein M422DRAFT_69753 [Sphaerobolus stellatus SS14]
MRLGSFSQPCIFISETDPTVNGFNSGLRPGGNATADFTIPIGGANINTTLWIYDIFPKSCGMGNIAVINANESSPENFDAAVRNAERLNGTATATSSTSRATSTHPSSTQTSSNSSKTQDTSFAIRPFIPIVGSAVLAMTGAAVLLF